MKLSKIVLKNFRGYCGEHSIDIENDITAFVGKNDAGKSTVLEALNIFFGEQKPERGDLNIHAEEAEMLFGATFTELPEQIHIDSTASTRLDSEYLVNENGEFEVVVRYSCTATNVTSKSETIIRCLHPTAEGYDKLLQMKISELKSKGKDLGIDVEDQRINSQWRKAIWGHAPNLQTKKVDLKIDDFETKAKAVYTNVSAQFPQFFLFKADRETSDGDSEAKDPMQLAVKEAQKELQQEIVELQEKIQTRVDEVAARALEKLQEMDDTLAASLKPTLKSTPKWSFDYRINDDRGVALNKRGSGTRRLVLLNFFRAEAERKSENGSGSIIYAIEEPETSQHPVNQEMIIDSLLKLSQDKKRQVIITSHSPQLVGRLPHASVKFVEYDRIAKNTFHHIGESGLVKAADSLGIHSNQKLGSAAAVVVVEGESDELFLKDSAKKLFVTGDIDNDFEGKKITVLPAGGCDNVSFWVQTTRLDELGLPYAIFVDSDRKSLTEPETKNEALVAQLKASNKVAITTKKREIENYIDPIHTNGATYGNFDDAKLAIATTDGLLFRGKPRKVFETKWPSMNSAQIKQSGVYVKADRSKGYEIIEIIDEILRIV